VKRKTYAKDVIIEDGDNLFKSPENDAALDKIDAEVRTEGADSYPGRVQVGIATCAVMDVETSCYCTSSELASSPK
jgi:hypothetical protein